MAYSAGEPKGDPAIITLIHGDDEMAIADGQPDDAGAHPKAVDIQPDDSGAQSIAAEDTPKSRRAFSSLKRDLSNEELNTSGAQKLLLELLARADEEISILKSTRDKYHDTDKRNGILEEKLKVRASFEIISSGCLAVGSAMVGYAKTLWFESSKEGPYLLVLGGMLIIVGIGAKVTRR